jgi:uncharacterized membrane protein
MSSRHSHVDPSARRARFTEPQPSRRVPWTAIIIGASITFLAIAILVAGRLPASAGVNVAATAMSASADLDVAAATFDDGAAHFYRYVTAAGREVRFFVTRSRDGKVRAALDACAVCYGDKRGYHQSGETMVCNKCSKAFRSDAINDVTGGCNPVPLDRTVSGDRVVVAAAGLERGAIYF